jgi:hypothetical protein
MKMKEGIDWTLVNFRCPNIVYEYLKKASKDSYLSMTDYLIQLILKDMKNNDKNDIK